MPLAEGPFAVLVDYTRILDFDVKRRHFRQELERLNEGARREDLPVHVRRSNVFEDSFRELFRRTPEEWKQRFYIVFEGLHPLASISLDPFDSISTFLPVGLLSLSKSGITTDSYSFSVYS